MKLISRIFVSTVLSLSAAGLAQADANLDQCATHTNCRLNSQGNGYICTVGATVTTLSQCLANTGDKYVQVAPLNNAWLATHMYNLHPCTSFNCQPGQSLLGTMIPYTCPNQWTINSNSMTCSAAN